MLYWLIGPTCIDRPYMYFARMSRTQDTVYASGENEKKLWCLIVNSVYTCIGNRGSNESRRWRWCHCCHWFTQYNDESSGDNPWVHGNIEKLVSHQPLLILQLILCRLRLTGFFAIIVSVCLRMMNSFCYTNVRIDIQHVVVVIFTTTTVLPLLQKDCYF